MFDIAIGGCMVIFLFDAKRSMISDKKLAIPEAQAQMSSKVYEVHLANDRKSWRLPWVAQASTNKSSEQRKYLDRLEEQAYLKRWSSLYLFSAFLQHILGRCSAGDMGREELVFYIIGDEAMGRMRLTEAKIDAVMELVVDVAVKDSGNKQRIRVVQVEVQVCFMVSYGEQYYNFHGEIIVGLFAVSNHPS